MAAFLTAIISGTVLSASYFVASLLKCTTALAPLLAKSREINLPKFFAPLLWLLSV